MPNWVRNKMILDGDQNTVTAVLFAIKNEEVGIGSIDFNKIIPMPAELNIECSSRTTHGCEMVAKYYAALADGRDTSEYGKYASEHPDEWELGKKAFDNKARYGYESWYDWCVAKWGTKWNANNVDTACTEDSIVFDTAWSAPIEVVQRLSEMFPDLYIELQYADEDLGRNCGMIEFHDGEKSDQIVYWAESRSAFEHACDVWEYDAQSMWEEYGREYQNA